MPFEKTTLFIEKLKGLIEKKDGNTALALLAEMHPADIADIYEDLTIEEAKFLYLLLDGEVAADVLAELEEDDRRKFLEVLPAEIVAKKFIDNMDSDDAADVIGDLSEERQEEILSHIEDIEQAGDIVDLLSYDEDTAGGLMAKEMVVVNANFTVLQCLQELGKQAEDLDEVYYVYVVDDKKILKGVLALKEMILNRTSTSIKELYDKEVISVKTDTPDNEVASIMSKYDMVAIPVVDSLGRLVGRITVDDVIDIAKEESERDYQMMSGISEDVESKDSIYLQVRARLPWLVIGLFGGILGALVIGGYEEELGLYPEMAFFIPLIAAMGGNVGVQSSAIVVQGLANNSIKEQNLLLQLLRELGGSFIIGLICASLIFLFNFFYSDSYALTLTVSISLFVVMIFASVFGAFIPLILNRAEIDPALATGPFITTLNDILGLFCYFYIGKLFFEHFLLT